MRVLHLWLTDFRCYEVLELAPAPGTTLIVGANGHGKTSVLEGIAWIATGRSLRGVPDAALVRRDRDVAVVRATVQSEAGREQLFEAELTRTGRNRVFVNRHAAAGRRERLELLRVTVFAPDDLRVVKGGPAERREYLDDLLVSSAPRYDAARSDYERVLRQRNALLRGGGRGPDDDATLDVFDAQLAAAAAELVRGRLRLVDRLLPSVARAYDELAGRPHAITAQYEADWVEGAVPDTPGDFAETVLSALRAARRAERDRGTTLVGPHRDEWRLGIDGLEARTQASQGEQRCLALALRLAGHRLVEEVTGEPPVLLLDDVFSELDAERARALVEHLPDAQAIITTAADAPEGIEPALRLRAIDGRLEELR